MSDHFDNSRKRPQWGRFIAAGMVLVFIIPVVVIPLRRYERQRRDLPAGTGKAPSPNDPVAHLSTGPKEYLDAAGIQADYQAALTSYQAFVVRAEQDTGFLERFCAGEPMNPEEGMGRVKSMAAFLQKAHAHEIDMSEIRRIARLKGIDLGEAPWITRAPELRELQIRQKRAQDACRERNKERLKSSMAASQNAGR